MSYVYRQQILNDGNARVRTDRYSSPDIEGRRKPTGPYKFGIRINRPKTESMADKALQIEANRAKRYVGGLNQELKMPMPRTPAVLAYLRWLDKMDAWHRKSGSSNHASARLRETEDLYSISGFGEPVVLPKIRKHPNPEKYCSKQVEKRYLDQALSRSNDSRDYEKMIRKKRMIRQAAAGLQQPAVDFKDAHSTSHKSCDGNTTNRTKFYIHAMNNFKYWPMELYSPPIHHTKYSFGTQFNPGRAGVVTDRIYTRPRANKHYWTEFQLRQNPVGSGNTVTGKVVAN